RDDALTFGPALRYRPGRDDDIEDELVGDLPEIDATVEAGLMMDGNWILDGNPRNRIGAGMDVMYDVGGESEGFNSTLSARYWRQASQAVDVGILGNVFFADGNFNDTYFGVSSKSSALTGLRDYSPDGGLSSFSIQPAVAYHFSDNWHAGA